ncbi:aldehyde dehydrogenase family protein [Paenibacillus chondroitinus]|uniref:aldehyde dehydrogenase (NAD(+)) n=1 Tax=Paenibacillus chondroitinus TaxID=59842 RepID=A0ABU6D982_9BACL|nr:MULTISPECIES: aldehyde dehydrogenase family protein [Paenibacillus]MCY9656658.1 aldehyde dehydrogenase family protein [Paenibacillus anseongense]MEB4794307.1 aldehyde dehydrogenase family protein [Paenibacillus chondroitinus]
MRNIDKIYIDGKFVIPRGTGHLELVNPSTREVFGRVTLGNEEDAKLAIAAAKAAFATFSRTSVEERSAMLQRLNDAILDRIDELAEANILEYGAPRMASTGRVKLAAANLMDSKEALEQFDFVHMIGKAKVVSEPVGVIGIITPWNASYSQITAKLGAAIAAGCTVVIKPSELSALQTQLLTECFHAAGIPAGVINVVNGLGATVGAELTRHPDVAMINFTGSTRVGKEIRRATVDSMKRVTLELGGKSPNIVLDDADFAKAIPAAVRSCYTNNGQACVAGTRLFVPEHRLEEVKKLARETVESMKVGLPTEADTILGPLVTEKQYNQVQRYILSGIQEGAELVVGGEGQPEGLEQGNFVRPTVFANVTEEMTIAKEEIFGPVLSILTYKNEEEAVAMANNTDYGLGAYISTANLEKANELASRIQAGVVLINGAGFEMKAPFGGFKHSGIGREYGIYGLEDCLETKTITGFDLPM